MVFLSAQPVDRHFLWQCEVQIVNFSKFGIDKDMHILVWYPERRRDEVREWIKLERKYPDVIIEFYRDEGVDLSLYIPQLRPHTIKKHFRRYPFLEKEVIFYHDCDIIFNYLPDFSKLIEGEVNWQSDASGYLDYDYLRRKERQGNIPEEYAVRILADIGGVTVDTFKKYRGKTGGAQYILKGVDADFWEDVERQVVEIRKAFYYGVKGSVNNTYFRSEDEGFQSWCADMWAVNMALWKRGKVTDVTPLLDFSWATSSADEYRRKPIYHNAGATGKEKGVFNKKNFIHDSPIGKKHDVSEKSASYFYVKAIEEVQYS